MDEPRDAFENQDLQRLLLFIYLIPVFGLLPATWTLARRGRHGQHRAVSRLVVTLGLTWGLSLALINTGLSLTESGSGTGLSLLLLNSVLTSSYFVTLLWLMGRLWKGQALDLPGFSRASKLLP